MPVDSNREPPLSQVPPTQYESTVEILKDNRTVERSVPFTTGTTSAVRLVDCSFVDFRVRFVSFPLTSGPSPVGG